MIDFQNQPVTSSDAAVVIECPPYQRIGQLATTGGADSMAELADLALRFDGVWSAVRCAAYSMREGSQFTKVGVLPFMAPSGQRGPQEGLVIGALRQYLSEACVGRCVARVVGRPMTYGRFSRLTPSEASSMLRDLVANGDVDIPSEDGSGADEGGWPELQLLVFAVTRDGGWPIMRGTQKAFDALAEALGFHPSHAIEPEFVEFDVLSRALGRWVDVLHGLANFTRWDVCPTGGDTALIAMAGGTDKAWTVCQMQLRASQMSERGVEDVMRHVSTIVAMDDGVTGLAH